MSERLPLSPVYFFFFFLGVCESDKMDGLGATDVLGKADSRMGGWERGGN